jgi:hypothetical protein
MNEETINQIMTATAKRYGCEDRFKTEEMDGLIVIDFWKIELPPFITKSYEWDLYKFQGNSQKDSYFCFRWKQDSNDLRAQIEAKIFSNYARAQEEFILTETGLTIPILPWVPCKKKVGTVCADGPNEFDNLFFVYKNIFINILGGGQLPNGEYFRDELATWLFNTLKSHPRSSVFPETLDEPPEV